jgi:ubiquinone/menaquinone biosynthesis C-methylase UbiE
MKAVKIRKNVSEAYTKAISGVTKSCCGLLKQSCCGPATDQSSAIAGLAGYTEKEMLIQQEASASSFGCGNPLAYSEVQEGEVVLDLGSGAGFDLLLASQKVGNSGRVIGVDMTDAMITAARRNIKSAGAKNIEIRKGLIESLPVDTESVDWVISNCVINLSPEKSKVFSEIYRVLKPGGRLLISDIVAESLPIEILESAGLYNSCVAGAISEEEYRAGLRQAGLEDVKVVARLLYEPEQIRSFFETEEVPGLKDLIATLSPAEREKIIKSLLAQIKGKVWSAKFSGGKPTS